jgi:nitroreductase
LKTGDNTTYDMLLDLVKARHSVRKFKPDPIPNDTIDKILEIARWAMSGANSQPWEFVVVTDQETKKQLRDAYSEYNTDLIFWMEQQREYPRSALRGCRAGLLRVSPISQEDRIGMS